MSLSRFSHFDNPVYSSSTNEKETSDSKENGRLNNGDMIITAGSCTRSRYYSTECSKIAGSFFSVHVNGSGQVVRSINTVVRPDNAGSSSVHLLPSGLKSLEIREMNKIGHVTVNIEQINGHLGPPIASLICSPYVDIEVQESNDIDHVTVDIEPEKEEWFDHDRVCSCIIL